MRFLSTLVWTCYHWLLCRLDPDHPVSLGLGAEQALERQQWGRAFDLSNAALKKRDDLVPAYFVRSVARLHLDDFKGALHDLNHFLALAEEPEATVYYWRGLLYVQRREWALALADFERVLDEVPDDPHCHYWKSYIFWQREEWEKMRAALEQVERLVPASAPAAELRGHLLLHEGQHREANAAYSDALAAGIESPELRYNRAVTARHLGQWAAAQADLEAIFRLDPDNLWARLELSNLALESGEYDEALRLARHTLSLEPAFFEAHVNEVAALMALDENEQARLRLETLRDLHPDQPLLEQLYGDLLAAAGETEAAIASHRRVLAQRPNDQEVRLALMGELLAVERYEEAAAEIALFLEADPESMEGYAARADLYRLSNRPAAMRADLDHLIALDPQHAWALTYRAAHRQWQGDAAGALADYCSALDAEPQQAWIWAFRGQFHMQSGRLDAALEDFQQAITLDPTDPWIRRQWAELLFCCGQPGRAAEVLDCLIADEPEDGFARLARAELYLLGAQWSEARQQLEQIVERAHELAWLAHAVLAMLHQGIMQRHHLALAKSLCPEPSYWGVSPARVLAQQGLVAWLEADQARAAGLLRAARDRLEPGERLWRALPPLLDHAGAPSLLAAVDGSSPFVTALDPTRRELRV